ncbi:hypothetical protein GCM10010964_14670 [Caldovatus sediminis]|uniref:OmpA-like domain-containing protein n=1 Tax=Caldovatus sediminis TaxID=2041189 RepID=A0A8J2ZA96_9PROT|nr:peptidoglycan -binding protein [Caldovatus sediminis]GGG27809.1 hypothetical protein GCM10010964_14670 [Caldovatus sediminis]
MAEIGGGRRARGGLNAWPGYVDALSTLLLVVIFVLMVFVLAQGFLSVALSSRDQALDRLHRQVAELGEMLALERGQTEELRSSLGRTTEELRAAAAAREALARQLAGLREERDRLGAERDSARAERDRLAARLADLDLAARGASERVATLEQRLAEALARAEAAGGDAARTVRDLNEARRGLALEREAREATERERAVLGEQLAATRAQLAEARAALEATRRDLAAMRREAEALDRQVRVERETVEARLSDIARLSQQVQALAALRDELERQAQEAMARAEEEARRRRAAEALAMRAGEQASEAERRRREAEAAAARAGSLAAEAERLRRLAAGEAAEATARAEEAERRRLAAEMRQAEALRLASAEEERRRSAETRAEEAARRAAEAAARAEADARAREAAQARAAEQTRLADSARAQLALLNRQIEALRAELARVNAALAASEAAEAEKDVQIANLGARLNAALAARVEELQQYRSDFFGRLRRILGDRPEVRVVGDRFVFQSEVLFPPGSADLSAAGERSVRDLARVLLDIARQIPPDIAWILRVDGHADRTPIRTARFASNWELSAARAIAVAQLLIQEGLPPNRVAATAFGDTQPLDPGDTPEAYARNRRIELRLTDR